MVDVPEMPDFTVRAVAAIEKLLTPLVIVIVIGTSTVSDPEVPEMFTV